MFSWLNFEELLIHNPIELINPSKDTISVAMSQKQYIEFFSNKYTYNGLYYDEEMDFCLFYYADPLQSYKEGDVYAQGYIDVEMKIYRVRWLCNVSISRSSGLLQTTDGTQGVPQEGGKYTHTAWAYNSDGTDRFSTIYPNLNLLNNSNFSSGLNRWTVNPGSNKDCKAVVTTDSDGDTCIHITGTGVACGIYTTPSLFNQNQITTGSVFAKGTGKIYLVGLEARATSNFGTVSTESYSKVGSTTQASSNTNAFVVYFRPIDGVIDVYIKFPKLEPGSTATPYMPSASEVTTADGPSYIGQYSDYTIEDSTNPSSYTWSEIQEDKWNISKTEMLVSSKAKTITMVLTGALAKCTKDKNITGWQNAQPNTNYNYRQPQYSLDIEADDFIISGYGLRGLKNG